MSLSILWRGPLSSCNYDCAYCPFGKTEASRAELEADAAALARFLAWTEAYGGPLSVFFTPWGEGLIHAHVQRAIARLSHLPGLGQVAIQTNLSARLDFLGQARAERVGLWSTFHPDHVRRERFVAQVRTARAAGATVSAGVVGMPRFVAEIEALRQELPPEVYLWVNAVRGQTYSDALVARISAVDPLFPVNLRRPYASEGRPCRAGESVIAVDGEGQVRRCNFLPEVIGNLYAPDFADALRPRLCPARTCGCHVGYVHLPHLHLYEVFGADVLSRAWGGWAEGLPAHLAEHRLDLGAVGVQAAPQHAGEQVAEGVELQQDRPPPG